MPALPRLVPEEERVADHPEVTSRNKKRLERFGKIQSAQSRRSARFCISLKPLSTDTYEKMRTQEQKRQGRGLASAGFI